MTTSTPAPIIRVIQNPLVSRSDSLTAEAVASVLSYLAAVSLPDECYLTSSEEMGRTLILKACTDALGTISGNTD